MMENTELLQKRFEEYAKRAFDHNTYEYSNFLDLDQQSTLMMTNAKRLPSGFTLWGGYEGAERKLAIFGLPDQLGYDPAPDVAWLRISPKSAKFAEELSHRDYLGSIMALGIKREQLGDLIVRNNEGLVIGNRPIIEYLQTELTSVRHTPVICRTEENPTITEELPEQVYLVVAAERLDAEIAAVYKLSRSQSQDLIKSLKVYVNSRVIPEPSHTLKENDIVSVRGYGRFRYDGIERETKKNRLRIAVRIYK